ncbi:MAG: PEGA domain-containing protein [Steroidobacteraceae bacterium]
MRIALIAGALLLSGCATLTRGTSEVLVIETDPAGAGVIVDELIPSDCITPCTMVVSRKRPLTVHIRRDGYEPITANILPTTAGAGAAGMAGNVLLGGIIGAGIDAWSGATQSLVPNPLKVTMVPIKPPAEPVTAAPLAAAVPTP